MSTPEERLLRQLFADHYGPRWSRRVYRLGERLEALACRAQGLDPLTDDDLCTGFWGRVEGLGARLKESHRERVSR